jgi:hypothetical protein
MAAPIAHIFLAVQMLAGPFAGLFNEKEFILGTSFPDIRYLKVVARAETHFCNVTLQQILQEKDSFKAGMLFHSFVDEQREDYVVSKNFYEKIPKFRFTSQSLKFAEDEILKTSFNIANYTHYFDEIVAAQKNYNISEAHIRDWHNFLQGYFKGNYSGKYLILKYFDLNEPNAWYVKRLMFSWFYARKMQRVMTTIVNDTQMKDLILDFYLNFADKFKTKLMIVSFVLII